MFPSGVASNLPCACAQFLFRIEVTVVTNGLGKRLFRLKTVVYVENLTTRISNPDFPVLLRNYFRTANCQVYTQRVAMSVFRIWS